MLKIFRNIREKLIDEGHFKQYLIYAFGEILLVVLGILIAIQLNILNENRKANAQLDQHLKEINISLNNDLKNWDQLNKRIRKLDKDGMYLLEFLKGEIQDPDTFQLTQAFLLSHALGEFTPNKIAFDDLVSSGLLNLIKNGELRLLMEDYYSPRTNQEQRDRYKETVSDLRFNFVDSRMLREFLITLMDSNLDTKGNYLAYQVDWQKMKQDEAYKQALGRFLAINVSRVWEMDNQKKAILRIMELIETGRD